MQSNIFRRTIEQYFQFMVEKKPEDWVQLFSKEAISFDPVGNLPNHIHDTYQKFFELLQFYREINSAPTAMFMAGNEVAVHWQMDVVAVNGKAGAAAGISIFTFDENGKITQLKAYWDDRQLIAQLR